MARMAISSELDRDAELRLHHVAVVRPPMPMMMLRRDWAQKSMTQPISTRVGSTSRRRMLLRLRQLLVVIVALVLHAGGERHHGQVVGVGDVVDVAGKAQGELGHGDQQRVAAARRRPLDVHGGSAGGLPQAASHVLAAFAQALDQTQGGCAFSLTQRGRGDGGNFDVLAIRTVLQAVDDLEEVQLADPARGNDLVGLEVQPGAPLGGGGQAFFRLFGNLPVLHGCCVVWHCWLLISEMRLPVIRRQPKPPLGGIRGQTARTPLQEYRPTGSESLR